MALTLSSANCSINITSSVYLDCGIWRPIDKMSAVNKFSLGRYMDFHILKVSCLNSKALLMTLSKVTTLLAKNFGC